MKFARILLIMSVLLSACKKDAKINPYDLPENNAPKPSAPSSPPDPASIAGLHQNMFAPTCANSGCHDGTFEPDFRTIESTYNTLVLRPMIKNNPAGNYQFRVLPGDFNNSVLYQRLVVDIDGQSGIMPLSVDQGSTWDANRAAYIENLKTWINNGARDIFGNLPSQSNLPPQLTGIFISSSGSTQAYPRNIQTGAIEIPIGTSTVDVYLAASDDATNSENLAYLKVKVSSMMNSFDASPENNLSLIPAVQGVGYSGTQVSFRFKFSLSLAGISTGQIQFIRAYLQDDSAVISEIPSTASAEYIKRFYSFQIGE